jgi:hypothetical protein
MVFQMLLCSEHYENVYIWRFSNYTSFSTLSVSSVSQTYWHFSDSVFRNGGFALSCATAAMPRTCASVRAAEHNTVANNEEWQGVLLHIASRQLGASPCRYYTDTSKEIILSLNVLGCKNFLLPCKSVYSLSNMWTEKSTAKYFPKHKKKNWRSHFITYRPTRSIQCYSASDLREG